MANPTPEAAVVDTTHQQHDQSNQHKNPNSKHRRSPRKPRSDSHSPQRSDSSSASSNDKSPNNGRRRKRNGNNSNNHKKASNRTQSQSHDDIPHEEKLRFVALDCEMVGVGPGGYKSSLARVMCIDWFGNILLDVYVQQDEPVTDYRTFVSGITPEHLESECALTFAECQFLVQDLLEGKVLVGHALKNDLHVLGIKHPWYDTRDTAKYEPFMKVRFDDGILWPRKLRDLAKTKLDRDIQIAGIPHSPYEDALAALDLYRKARTKWEKAMEYKINKTKSLTSSTVTPAIEIAAAQ